MDSEAIIDKDRQIEEGFIYLGNVEKFLQDKNIFRFICGKTVVLIKILADDIVRIVMNPNTIPSLDTTKAVVFNNNSMAECNAKEDNDKVTIETSMIKVLVYKYPFSIEIYNQEGGLFFKTSRKDAFGWDRKRIGSHISIRDCEHFYGLGEKAGWLDKRGENLTMWNTDMFDPHNQHTKELYVTIPFYIGLAEKECYGLFLDNASRTHFNMGEGQDEYLHLETEAGKFDFYVIYGPQMKRVISRYSDITGRMPLPPMWSIGYQQEKYSYSTEAEVRSIAQNFRRRDIPCDVIYIDIHHMDGYRVYTWDNHRFPDPEKLIADLKKDGFHSIVTVNPGVKKDAEFKYYIEGMQKDYFCKKLDGTVFVGKVWPGDSVFPDFTREEVRNWWAAQHSVVANMGIEGIWNDMNEPAVFRENKNGTLEDHTMDLDVVHGNDGKLATHRELHNIYGLFATMSTYAGLKEHLKGKRPFVLSRSGYAGVQRYAAIWTGDNRSFWEHLSMGIPMLLNMGLSGLPFVGNDIGGYMGNCNGELYTRWIQFGAFVPFFRTCYSINLLPQEPWAFGEKYENIAREFIKLRYKLMTHMYNLFHESSITGIPIIRPLILEYQDDPNVCNLSDEFLLGDSILVAPVCKPDSEYREVYLPEGIWYDFFTEEKHTGGKYILGYAPIDRIPVYVKSGSIIPVIASQNYIGEKDITTLELEIYPEAEHRYELYEDDGETFEYENGIYSLYEFSCRKDKQGIVFDITPKKTDYRTKREKYLLKFKNMESQPQTVRLNGIELVEIMGNEIGNTSNVWLFNCSEKTAYVQICDSKTKADSVSIVLP